MIEFTVFPGGKKRAVTFSYDDGAAQDERLIGLFDRYGVKATFHLNGINYMQMGEEEMRAVRERYAGHEIACHTLRHGYMERMPGVSLIGEIVQDRQVLEKMADGLVMGMSYPCGSVSEDAVQALRLCGIAYSRTTTPDHHMQLPKDFLRWDPTCHHKDAMPLAEKFMAELESYWCGLLLYIWGHSHELCCEEDWAYMERLVAKVAGCEKIWYATNGQIYEYAMAQRALRVSADEKILHNPTATDVWVDMNRGTTVHIPAGQTVRLG